MPKFIFLLSLDFFILFYLCDNYDAFWSFLMFHFVPKFFFQNSIICPHEKVYLSQCDITIHDKANSKCNVPPQTMLTTNMRKKTSRKVMSTWRISGMRSMRTTLREWALHRATLGHP